MSVKIHGVGDGCTVELYTALYTGKLLYNARNRPIQLTLLVSRMCIAIQLYSEKTETEKVEKPERVRQTVPDPTHNK